MIPRRSLRRGCHPAQTQIFGQISENKARYYTNVGSLVASADISFTRSSDQFPSSITIYSPCSLSTLSLYHSCREVSNIFLRVSLVSAEVWYVHYFSALCQYSDTKHKFL